MRFEVIAINDDRDFCECCGKSNLKRVVWIKDNETGEIKHFGTKCAQSPKNNFTNLKAEIKREIKRYEKSLLNKAMFVMNEYRKRGGHFNLGSDGTILFLDKKLHEEIKLRFS